MNLRKYLSKPMSYAVSLVRFRDGQLDIFTEGIGQSPIERLEIASMLRVAAAQLEKRATDESQHLARNTG